MNLSQQEFKVVLNETRHPEPEKVSTNKEYLHVDMEHQELAALDQKEHHLEGPVVESNQPSDTKDMDYSSISSSTPKDSSQ